MWDALRAHKRKKFDADRARFLADAQASDDGGWTKHTEFHWSRMVNGERLDYWPSRKKFQFRGKVKRGDVMAIVRAAKESYIPAADEKRVMATALRQSVRVVDAKEGS